MDASYKISVFLEPETYKALDEMTRDSEDPRSISDLINKAICELIKNNKKKKESEEQLKRGYEDLGEINLGLAEMCLEADNQALYITELNLTESE